MACARTRRESWRRLRRADRASWRSTRSRRSPCARTRRADASAPEEECSVRTPFQRDRDRILHSKPFRRLKGKTQVFIDPAGDHYRTRMTHTLETTGIARVVARALQLNEDLTEAIGLGHDLGHPPFGHAGEAALDSLLDGGFRHNEQSAKIARRLNLTREVVDGILTHTGDREPRDARGEDRPRRRPRRLHQPRHRRRDPLRHPRRERPAARRRSRRSARPAPSGSTRSCTTWSRPRPSPATSPRATRSASAMLSLRGFMFDHVYLGPGDAARARARARDDPADLRAPGRARRRPGGDRRVHRRDDRPVRAVVRCQPSRWRGSRTAPSRP